MSSNSFRILFCGVWAAAAFAQAPNTVCVTSATPVIVHSEGLAERTGGIVYDCTGQPNTSIQVNLTITLNTNITNRLSTGNTLSGIVFTIDTGSGPLPVTIPALLTAPSTLVYNGLSFQLSSQGKAQLAINDIRANATQAGVSTSLYAFLGISNNSLLLSQAYVNIGTPQRGLYSSLSSRIVCAPNGSRLPDTITFSNLITSGAIFASTRVTEGFADSFQSRSGWANLNADSGTRFLVTYSGFPTGARLFAPDVIAGSDATQPTAGGDFGIPASGGAYTPGGSGSLLLARVAGADPTGAGGFPVYTPGAPGSGAVQFDTVSELNLTNGSAYVVYEVVDADPSRFETAQFPTFLGAPPTDAANAFVTNENVTFAPVSTVSIATTRDPLPRFVPLAPRPDCSIIGDCNASYLPKLSVQTYQTVGGGAVTPNTLLIHNLGTNLMQWWITATYPPGTPAGWLHIDPNQGVNNATVELGTTVTNLPAGTYTANVVVDAGPLAGSQTIPVTLTVAPAPPPPAVKVNTVVNAASFDAVPVVPGSLVSVMGSGFTGKVVSVTFDGRPATILFSNDKQINLMVPPGLTSATAKMVVLVDGASSSPVTVNVAAFAPAIFKGAILNQDWTVNGVNNPVDSGSYLVIYATGLSGSGTITAKLGDQVYQPAYAGPAPGFPGVQQINLQIPSGVSGATLDLYLCGASTDHPDAPVCSAGSPITVR